MKRLFSPRLAYFWQRHLPFRFATYFLGFYLLLALTVSWLPLPFEPNQLDLQNLSQEPLDLNSYSAGEPFHWLGTDHLGRDVLANLLFGCRTSLIISVPVMTLATMVGIYLGSLGGFLGDRSWRVSLTSIFLYPLAAVLIWFYSLYLRQHHIGFNQFINKESLLTEVLISLIIGALILLLALILSRFLKKTGLGKRSVFLPVDLLVVKLIELTTAIPRLILLLCLVAFVYPSLFSLMALATIGYWPGIARLARAEVFKVKNLPFVQVAQALGLSPFQVFYRHVLGHVLAPVFVAFTFGLASLLALESTLSFLGIGVPADLPSWGRLIAGIKSDMSAWWLAVLPGGLLATTVISLQTCSHYLQKALLTAESQGH